MAKSKRIAANEKIADAVVGGYKKIEDGVVGGYKKIEEGVVGGYKKIEDAFVDRYLTHAGETVQDAKEPLNKSSSTEQRIFFTSCAVPKVGNTYSIPPLLEPSSGEKSLAVSSRRFNQSFPKARLAQAQTEKGCAKQK